MNNIIKHENGRQPATFGTVVDQIFQNSLNRFFDDGFWGQGAGSMGQGLGSVPVNIKETDKTYEMELYAPGLNKSDFHLDVEGDMLTVSFEKKAENKQDKNKEGWVREEYKMQSFNRSFSIGDTVDVTKISARYENGVLFLQLPKKEHAQRISRSVEIQ
ncbi:MAG TPA: Hsp20/alpha crystallin family protein [Puia sp.]